VDADRSESGAEIVQILSNRFIEQARMSKNQFAKVEDFTKLSIYNHNLHNTAMSFLRIYKFNENTTDIITAHTTVVSHLTLEK
jgi:hypothetical protein